MDTTERRKLDRLLRRALQRNVIEYYDVGPEIVSLGLHGALIALHVERAYPLLQALLAWWAGRQAPKVASLRERRSVEPL